MSGLVNYYGRTPESDNIHVKPLLLQKGRTKLALYGMSNVRDQRLHRTFQDGNVKFFRPGTQKDDWFNILSVHQNHHAYAEDTYLPEHFLPDFMDLVVWGHEHECLIDPRLNPQTNFRVMQPGSSVATSLVPGEAVPKHVAILTIKGKDFDVETIRLKTVRPFVYRDIALSDNKRIRDLAYDGDNKSKVHAYLTDIIQEMIEEANSGWLELQRESGEDPDEDFTPKLPLIRLRVEFTAPEGGEYHFDNAQRLSNRFMDKVANTSDVIQFHRKKANANRTKKANAEVPEDSVLQKLSLEGVQVSKLVEEFLTAQSLTLLPQNQFSDSVGQFVEKDDANIIGHFIEANLEHFHQQLLGESDGEVDEDMSETIEQIKASLEKAFEKGEIKRTRGKGKIKDKPENWDSDEFGHWADEPASRVRDDLVDENDSDEESVAPKKTTGRGRGRGGKAATASSRKTATAMTKRAPAKATGRGKKKQVDSDEEEEDDDVVMLDDDDDEDDSQSQLFVKPANKAAAARASKATAASKATTTSRASPAAKPSTRGGKAPASSGTQSQLNFSQTSRSGPAKAVGGRAAAPRRLREPSEDEISDDDAFEPPSTAPRGARGGRR